MLNTEQIQVDIAYGWQSAQGRDFPLLLIMLLMFSSFSAPVSGALKSGTAGSEHLNRCNQRYCTAGRRCHDPVYQGSIQLKSDETNTINFSAMPRDFNTDDTASALQLVNPLDTEGDIFAVPPVRWEEKTPNVAPTSPMLRLRMSHSIRSLSPIKHSVRRIWPGKTM